MGYLMVSVRVPGCNCDFAEGARERAFSHSHSDDDKVNGAVISG